MGKSKEEKDIGEVYRERNLLALAFVHQFRGSEYDYGYWPDEEAGVRWRVVWVDTPEGQVAWHMEYDMLPDWLPKRDPDYDGYSTNEKNRRVWKYIDGPDW